jgi:beta-mannosidase
MKSIDLTGKWQFKAVQGTERIPPGVRGMMRWMNGTVPGTVHTDLLAAEKIADPFYRMNENDVQWIDRLSWIYRRTFRVPQSLLDQKHIELVAEGLDTFATLSVNGQTVGTTANMFMAHRIPLNDLLRPGRNTIEIVFDSPTLRSQDLEREHGRLQVALEPHRVYARKAQYSFGWDWGPKLTTSGIWRPIRIDAHSGVRLSDPCVRVLAANPHEAEIEVEVSVEGWQQSAVTLDIHIGGIQESYSGRVTEGKTIFRTRFISPHLWWPNRYGEQPLYHAEFILREGEAIVDATTVRFAVRTVRLVQEPDGEGQSFIMEINGTRIFCKGADWIPADTFLPRISDATYRRLLTMARDASMNMIRVWGGGIYERDLFYDECDRLGLMVWQDFMFACAEYPDHPAFLDEIRREAESTVKRLRNHPSIVLWCGNNECEWIFCSANPGKNPDQMHGSAIFREVLPAVVTELDPGRPYWRSSPFGGGSPNAEDSGNHHQWEVWSMWRDFTGYRDDRAKFVSEFGFQAPAHRSTLERVLSQHDRTPQSRAMEHHNKQVEGTERLFRFMAAHYRVNDVWEDFLHTGQLVQAAALKCAVEHWRRRKFHTAGALFWQLNDCWPVTSWAVIDSDLRPKAAYFAARRFFAPILVSFAPVSAGAEVWITNDLLRSAEGTLSIRLQTFSGEILAHKNLRVHIPANGSERTFAISREWMKRGGPASYLRAELSYRGQPVSVNRFFFLEPKHCDFPRGTIHLAIRKSAPGTFRIVLRSSVFVHGVALSSPDPGAIFHDNFVDLDPGVPHEISVTSRLSVSAFRNTLIVFAHHTQTRKAEVYP